MTGMNNELKSVCRGCDWIEGSCHIFRDMNTMFHFIWHTLLQHGWQTWGQLGRINSECFVRLGASYGCTVFIINLFSLVSKHWQYFWASITYKPYWYLETYDRFLPYSKQLAVFSHKSSNTLQWLLTKPVRFLLTSLSSFKCVVFILLLGGSTQWAVDGVMSENYRGTVMRCSPVGSSNGTLLL